MNLPSDKLLNLYRKFDKQASGWCYQNIETMSKIFDQSGKHLENKIGMLIFDEMKIKEGLVWSAETNKLLGFTDIETAEGDEIATNIIQFFFKSLFSDFAYPCAYLAVKNLTGAQVYNAFWEGIYLLHRFGFTILLTICDE